MLLSARFFRQFSIPGAMVLFFVGSKGAQAEYLYGKVNSNFQLDGKTFNAGSFIAIEYDGDDVWVTDKPFVHRIKKSDVTVVKTIKYNPVLIGKMNRRSIMYTMVPPLYLNNSSLEQPEAPREFLPAGTEVHIFKRQGDDYIVAYPNLFYKNINLKSLYGRLPVSVVDVDTGQVIDQTEITVPHAPTQ